MRSAAVVFVGLVGCGAAAPAHVEEPRSPSRTLPVTKPSVSTLRPLPVPSASAPKSRSCPDDMVLVGTFCVDRYEAPNVRGRVPLALQTAGDGEAWCSARGKSLCTEEQWVRACQGSHGRHFPYGDVHRASACNDDRLWREVSWRTLARWPDPAAVAEGAHLFQGEPSGARAACVSEDGVYDLTGNVAEWVRRSDAVPRPGYEHVLKGCYWAGCYHQPEPDCAFRNSAHPGTFRTYEAGFRCCCLVKSPESP